jgi:hypothetical protein
VVIWWHDVESQTTEVDAAKAVTAEMEVRILQTTQAYGQSSFLDIPSSEQCWRAFEYWNKGFRPFDEQLRTSS